MVNKDWLIRTPGNIPALEIIEEDDVVILIQDAVLKIPYIENLLICEVDAKARGVKENEDKLVSYQDIIDIIEKAEKVVVW